MADASNSRSIFLPVLNPVRIGPAQGGRSLGKRLLELENSRSHGSKASRMKLLLYSHFFAPSIGGVETIVLSLASGLANLSTPGGEKEFNVLLVTQTPATGFDDSALPFRVIRQPSAGQLWKLIRNSDVIHLAGPALAALLLSLIARKP